MTAPARYDGLVLLSGRQLWSHLDALAQWGQGLGRIAVVAAHSDDEPGGPVDRLRTFIAAEFPDLPVEVLGPVNDDAPEEVLAEVTALVERTPGAWLVNASGGTRLMFLGAAQAAAELASVTVVFRDDDGPWYRLGSDCTAEELGYLDVDATDDFRALDLLRVTWADEERRVHARPHQPPRYLGEAADRCLRGTGWLPAFREAQRRAPGSQRLPDGPAFELFVLALVRRLGVAEDDALLSAKLRERSQSLQEVDVVVNAQGRLHVIDCKVETRPHHPLGMQIREAFATRRLLGDDAAQVVLLRPLQTVPPELRNLCFEYDLRLIDRDTLRVRSLPEVLSTYLRLERPVG